MALCAAADQEQLAFEGRDPQQEEVETTLVAASVENLEQHQPTAFAEQYQALNILQPLCKKCNANGDSALIIAAKAGNWLDCSYLVQYEADII